MSTPFPTRPARVSSQWRETRRRRGLHERASRARRRLDRSRSEGKTSPSAPGERANQSGLRRGTALVRQPGPRLAEGVVTFLERTPVDVDLARTQHQAYRSALADAGWAVREVAAADHCPDSVFVEDTVVVCEDLAVLARPGLTQRRPEVAGTETAVRELGLEVVRIQEPATLDGGDVLQVGSTVYVGRSSRTNPEGIRQLRHHLRSRARVVVPVLLRDVLHLKSAVTALPDDTFVGLPDLFDRAAFPTMRAGGRGGGRARRAARRGSCADRGIGTADGRLPRRSGFRPDRRRHQRVRAARGLRDMPVGARPGHRLGRTPAGISCSHGIS